MKSKLAYLGFFSLLGISIILGILCGFLYQIYNTLPSVEIIKEYTPAQITRIFSADGEQIARFCLERRILVSISEINQNLLNAVLAIEDANFYEHKGIYWPRVIQAFWKNLEKGSYVQGASTITQQLARSIFLYPQKTISRKIKEALLAHEIEKKYKKNEILELYLNQIYLGDGSYGVEAAANSYFKKKAKDLEVAEAALLAGSIRAPSKYSPFRHPELAQKRCRVVLRRMKDEGFITVNQYQKALKFVFSFEKKGQKILAPYFVEYIRQYLQKKYGRSGLYKSGLQVYTTLDIHLQKIAQKYLRWGLEKLDKRQGYRPLLSDAEITDYPIEKIQEAIKNHQIIEERFIGIVKEVYENKVIVDVFGDLGEIEIKDMSWAKVKHPREILKVSDRICVRMKRYEEREGEYLLKLALDQEPLAQGAVVAIDPKTGYILAMVGGYDFSKSKFNRAVQALRQPGSSFKPFIYTTALLKRKTLSDIIIDSPIIYKDENLKKDWKPANYYKRFTGPTTLREAIEHSSNVVTVKLLKEVGIDNTVDLVRKMGITAPLSADLSLALGASGVSLLELTSAYGIFANQGRYSQPLKIKTILDDKGQIIENNDPSSYRVLDEQTNFLITSLLEGVVQHGTGWRAKYLGRPVAGKTGTTNECVDAWFIGFSPDLVVGVWVGFDKYRSLGEKETGSRAACPIWVKFMSQALKDQPFKNFVVPEGIIRVSIDAESGLRATNECKNIIMEYFIDGTEPKQLCECGSACDRFFTIDFQTQKDQLLLPSSNPEIPYLSPDLY